MSTKRASSRKRGYTSKWEKERKKYLDKHSKCVECSSLATCVDHIKPHKGDSKLFWRRSNWQPMCHACHSRKTATQDGGFGNPTDKMSKACDVNGVPTDARHHWN